MRYLNPYISIVAIFQSVNVLKIKAVNIFQAPLNRLSIDV
jgi:hypothetical protein